ncbi:MAG: HAMP domain-containing histidine kinase, partial [Chitinophagaceae bacterium]
RMFPEKNFIGIDYFNTILPHDHARVQEVINDVYQTNHAHTLELSMKGPESVLEVSFIPLKENSHTAGLIIIKNDITERKVLEKELAISADRMVKQNRELEEFTYFASHDLKAPVTNLQSLIEMVNEEELPDRNLLLIDKMRISIEHMQKIIGTLNEVLATKQSLILERERLRFDNVFRQTIRSIEQMVNNSGATCTIDFSDKPEVLYPPVHLHSIMQNLLTNAIKYSKDGQPPKIDLKSGVRNSFVYLQVKDNGLGMNLKRDGKNLFGLFKRFHNHVEGDGIGLHIIKAIAETYGGTIEVESQPDHGATFTVYLYPESDESR